MPFYMLQFSYTPEAWAALTENPQGRRQVLAAMLEQLGCRLVTFYYAFGDYDGLAIYEAPDDATAGVVTIAVVKAGHVKANRATRLFSMEETLAMMQRAGIVPYQAPSTTS